MYLYKILLPKLKLPLLYYRSAIEYPIGALVQVPLRSEIVTGVIWELSNDRLDIELKNIIEKPIFPCRISANLINFMKRASDYYLADLSSIAKLVLPVDINESPIKTTAQEISLDANLAQLSGEQSDCLEIIQSTQKPILIKGVTGSGKTEVYFHAIMQQLQQGKQALLMLPEIALSQQIIARFSQRFGFTPVIWNSSVSTANKKRILRGLITGDVKIIIGARSALFLPYKDLGIIVVDEEHDPSYKQNDGVLYNARDMSVLKGHIENCKVLLISATPSIESINNAMLGKYQLVELKSRHNEALLPEIEIIDMRQERLFASQWLSQKALDAIKKNIAKQEQVMIFLNRRGYAPLMLCRCCGHKVQCQECSVAMVVHKSQNQLQCHHCGLTKSIYQNCPECEKGDNIIFYGPGIERIEEELKSYFPDSRIATLSRDQNLSDKGGQELLGDMEQGKIDIMIGTQVITKGYHFAHLTLVIIIDADSGFMGSDLRAGERSFQLLHQVGGRAGRESKKGTVMLQTYMPQSRLIEAIRSGREKEYIDYEIEVRQKHNMPPFSRVASIMITGSNEANTQAIAKQFAAKAPKSDVKVMGPAEAMIYKIAGKYRYKILVIADKKMNLQKYLTHWLKSYKIPASYQVKIDIDPQELC